MASPFRVFRKYLKPLMVVFGVMIMISFVVLDPLTKFLTGGQGGGGRDTRRDANAVAVSWENDELTNQELANLVQRRGILRGFLDQVEGMGARSSYLAGLDPPPLRVIPLRLAENPQEGVEQSVVQTRLYADAAREAGMDVDDDAIVQYLLLLGRDRVTTDDMRAMIGPEIPVNYVFDAIRDELLARNYLMSNLYAFQTVTPEQRWKDWLRVNDRVVLEAAALPVESYLIEVKDPTDSELQEFFDEHKKYEKQPDAALARSYGVELPMADVGFRIPRKIDVQFVEADFAGMVAKAEAEVTEEEVQKYYDENKDLFVKADTGLLDDTIETDATTTPPATESSETGAATEEAAPATEPPAEDAAPAATPADSSESVPPAETPPAAEAPPAAEETGEKAPADSDQSSIRNAADRNVFRQVAFLQEEKSDAADETAATEEPATTAAPAAESTPAATAPAADTPVATPPTEGEATTPGDTAEAATTTSAEPSAPADTSTAPPADEKPQEYQSLDEVRDLIRHDIAYRKVTENLTKEMEEVLGELTGDFNTYLGQLSAAAVNDEEKGEKSPPPAPPAALADLKPIADKHGFTYAKTGDLPWLEFRETPIGKSQDPSTGRPLSGILFGSQDIELYQPISTMDIDRNRYIAMKTKDTPGRIPELKEVRDEVVRAWKMAKAKEFALKDAEKQAKAAQEAKSALIDFFSGKPDVEVVQVDPFSELTRGDVPDQFGQQRFRLSQPDGLTAAGPEFMKKVLGLKNGEVAAVLNHDHTIAYVVRVVEHQDSPDELRNAYLADANSWDGLPAMTDGHVVIAQQAVNKDLSGGKGVDWKRSPDRNDDSEEVEE